VVTLRSILCPVDFSEQSRDALRWALALAVRHSGRVTVLTAVDPLLAQTARIRFGLDLLTQARPALRTFVSDTLPHEAPWAPPITYDARVGHAPDVILDTARQEHADMIVMGTHGLGGVRKLLLGSTAERVLRRTRLPVMAVPGAHPPGVVLDPAGPRFAASTILAASDLSEASAEAVEWAAALGQELAATVVLAHVVTPLVVPSEWQPYVAGVDEDWAAQARAALAKVSASLRGRVRSEVVVQLGRPPDAIAAIAEQRSAALIVMGLGAPEGARRPQPGSIAYRVLCLAHVPVLVVPSRPS
jgi:universal stress protein A